MKTRWMPGLLLGAVCSAGWAQTAPPTGNTPAPAQSPPENIGKPIGEPDAGFDHLDGNRDRRISRTEATASTELTARFAEFDADGDGFLSRSEYETYGREPSNGAAAPSRQR